MKPSIIIISVNVLMALLYALAFVSSFFIDFGFGKIWFSLALCLISVGQILKGYYFRQDSSWYIGFIFLLCGLFGIFFVVYNFSLIQTYPAYLLMLALSSLFVYFIFRQNIHLKLFAIIAIEVLILSVYKLGILPKYPFWIINIIYLMVLFVLLFKVGTYNTRRR